MWIIPSMRLTCVKLTVTYNILLNAQLCETHNSIHITSCVPKMAGDKKLQREKLMQKWNEMGLKTEEKAVACLGDFSQDSQCKELASHSVVHGFQSPPLPWLWLPFPLDQINLPKHGFLQVSPLGRNLLLKSLPA